VWVEPAERRPAPALALWLPPLSATKEWVLPFLRDLASQDFVAVSIDPWGHGQRDRESPEQLRARVFGDFRRQMRPIFGLTTLDCLSVLDWAREDPSRVLPQGTADTHAQWFYDQLDPLTHLERYKRGTAVSFGCGEDDTHISPDWALRFQAELIRLDPQARERVRVTAHPELGHLDAAQNPELRARCLAWLSQR
jgi:hypothetical protein